MRASELADLQTEEQLVAELARLGVRYLSRQIAEAAECRVCTGRAAGEAGLPTIQPGAIIFDCTAVSATGICQVCTPGIEAFKPERRTKAALLLFCGGYFAAAIRQDIARCFRCKLSPATRSVCRPAGSNWRIHPPLACKNLGACRHNGAGKT